MKNLYLKSVSKLVLMLLTSDGIDVDPDPFQVRNPSLQYQKACMLTIDLMNVGPPR